MNMKSILIVDDDEIILLGISRAISMICKDFNILTALNGKQAIEKLTTNPVDLIVTDLKMPIMTGYELVEYASAHFPFIPICVMTGDYLPEVKPKFKNAAVSQFFLKPFCFTDFADKISILLMSSQPVAV